MSVIIVTGSAGLIGSAASEYFAGIGFDIVGIDNDMRREFFGADASTVWNRKRLEKKLGKSYRHYELDIRDADGILALFKKYAVDIRAVIHTAAQPSHDWAASNPQADFTINANGTLNVLEATRQVCPQAVFIFTSTNKVYGDTPNQLPLVELEKRWEIQPGHEFENGISERMSVDNCLHSLFGVSKLAADQAVQEYGRYFDMDTACFRGGCLTGPNHSGAELHGFLAYLMKCTVTGKPYKINGYKGKQVRDNIHNDDLVRAFHEVIKAPRGAQVYNMGGGRTSNCSMLEAIEICEKIAGRRLSSTYAEQARTGDHIWWISDNGKFIGDYPSWRVEHTVEDILREIYEYNKERWTAPAH
jgi:CDP-paratose 2-epimerase